MQVSSAIGRLLVSVVRRGFALALVSLPALAVTTPAQLAPISADGADQAGPRLQISSPKSTYRIGEVIPIDLAFTAHDAGRYQINMATYDRRGRMEYEKFRVEPAGGASDPLTAYFKSQSGFIGGGLTNFRDLSDTPYVTRLNLNEWVRFDKTGNYRVTVSSVRVGSRPSSHSAFTPGAAVESNAIDLQIVAADAEWEKARLKEILKEFDASPAPKFGFSNSQRFAAATELRYLASADAAREMARHLRGDENQVDWQCLFGLIGSLNRGAGLEEMHRLLLDPEFPVTGMFLEAMAIIPLNPDNDPTNLQQQKASNLADARSALTQALSAKQGLALPVSADTLVSSGALGAGSETNERMIGVLISHFDQLSIDQQNLWLGMKWGTVKSSQWIPTLQKIATEYVDYPGPSNMSPGYEHRQLTAAALTHWYELEAAGARPAVIAEILRPRPRYNGTTLGLLPERVLANEQHAIADHFVATDDWVIEGRLSSLLYEYADADVLDEVLPKITRKVNGPAPWPCAPENYAIAYVAKVDPERAKPLQEHVATGCGKFRLGQFVP